jgi:hypothetical protein
LQYSINRNRFLIGYTVGIVVVTAIFAVLLKTFVRAWFLDVVTLGMAAAIFSCLQRDSWRSVLTFTSISGGFYFVAMKKLQMLGSNLAIADIFLYREVIKALTFFQLTILTTILLVLLGSVLRGFEFRIKGARGVFGTASCLTLLCLFMFAEQMHETERNNRQYNPFLRHHLRYQGLIGTIIKSHGESRAQQTKINSLTADAEDLIDTSLSGVTKKPNIYVVMLESLMNPVHLRKDLLNDALDPRLRANLSGHSVSPVYGGMSAEAEFEVLCGIPGDRELGYITYLLLRGAPINCLPNKLSRLGYKTRSFVAVEEYFFNAGVAYRSLGFGESYFLDAFEKKDFDSGWVATEDYVKLIKPIVSADLLANKQPSFNFIFTVSSHNPFTLNKIRNPNVHFTDTVSENDYLNSILVNTKLIMDFVDWIIERDPSALILVIGDHQPSLGQSRTDLNSFLIPFAFIAENRKGDASEFTTHYGVHHLLIDHLYDRSTDYKFLRTLDKNMYKIEKSSITRCESSDSICDELVKERKKLKRRLHSFIKFSGEQMQLTH